MRNGYITVIGAANIDIYGIPFNSLVPRNSNPGEIKTYTGGVARNIAENLARLGLEVRLLTVFGDDLYGAKIMKHSREVGINVDYSVVVKGASTSAYLAILDSNKDMEVAVNDMKILEKIDIQFITERLEGIRNSSVCILDTNIPKNTINFILESNPCGVFFLDAISSIKAARVVDMIGRFHSIKPNKFEAEILAGIPIKNREDIVKASEILLGKGVRRVFISMSKDGIFYNDGFSRGFLKVVNAKPVNVTGAGDAFSSALAYCYLNNMNMEETARFAITSSVITIEDELAVSPNMSVKAIHEKMKGLIYE